LRDHGITAESRHAELVSASIKAAISGGKAQLLVVFPRQTALGWMLKRVQHDGIGFKHRSSTVDFAILLLTI
jgi:hypothetical protein